MFKYMYLYRPSGSNNKWELRNFRFSCLAFQLENVRTFAMKPSQQLRIYAIIFLFYVRFARGRGTHTTIILSVCFGAGWIGKKCININAAALFFFPLVSFHYTKLFNFLQAARNLMSN